MSWLSTGFPCDAALRTDLLSESSPYRNWWPENALHSSSVFKKAEERLRRLLELDPWTGRDAVDTYDGTLSVSFCCILYFTDDPQPIVTEEPSISTASMLILIYRAFRQGYEPFAAHSCSDSSCFTELHTSVNLNYPAQDQIVGHPD